MGDGERVELAAALQARLAAAGLAVPAQDAGRLERDLALHLERVAALAEEADLGPSDPPFPIPTRTPSPAASPAAPRPSPASAPAGLVEAARLVREGEASSAELVDLTLTRIQELDGRVGAFVAVLGDRARAEAADRDAERRRGRALGPLHGVPVAVKDLVDVAGVVTGAGSPKLAGNLAAADAEVVARLRAAGAVPVGKTRTHEFAYGVLTPGTVNPWDPARIAGGSSGGSAAAVAAGLVPAAIGSDTAGSIRIPAACCGVVGLKPTWGRVPATGVWPLSWSCDHVGPIAADVADVALLDGVLAGDPAAGEGARPRPGPGAGAESPLPPPHIGRLVGDELGPVDPAVTAAMDELCRRLEARGASVDEVVLPLRAARGAVATIVLAEAAAAHARLLAETGEDGYSRAVLSAIRIGQSALAGEYLTGLRYRGRFAVRVEELLAERDALLLPTLPCTAPPTGQRTLTVDGVETGVQAALTALPGPFNCSGSPVVSLPAGMAPSTGEASVILPVGASLVGRIGGDRELLRLAAWVEAALPPAGRPAISA
jgi:aspartyl-tRNA(Asn)/glutamyl-tRNA(Gln) amidotransferase subunit A